MRFLELIRFRRLGTRAIMALLVLVLILQIFAIAGFVWERNNRVNPTLQRYAAGEMIQALRRFESLSEQRQQRVMRGLGVPLGPVGSYIVPAHVLQETKEGRLFDGSSYGPFMRAFENRLEDSSLELKDFEVTFVTAESVLNLLKLRDDMMQSRGNQRGPGSRGNGPRGDGFRGDSPRGDNQRLDRPQPPLGSLGWLRDLAAPGDPIPVLEITLLNGNELYIFRHMPGGVADTEWRPLGFIVFVFFLPLLIALWALYRLRQATLALGAAATRFGNDLEAPHLTISGPAEVNRTVEAFNAMQGRIRDLMSERTRMLAAISHDLRTQLTKLRMRAEFITPEKQRDKAVADIERLDRLLGQVVQVARLDAGSEAREPAASLDVAKQVRAMIADMGWGALVTYQGPDSLGIETGRATLERILSNLTENALRYGERAEISLDQNAHALVICIDDFGPGIATNELDRVFEPFYRVEASRNLATGGSGLGLAIVKGLVEQLGGSIALINLDRGGLRAQVTLPIEG